MIDLSSTGRWLLVFGLLLALVGGFLLIVGRIGLPFGKLPGDFRFQLGSISCFFPLASSIILSIVLTLVLNLVLRSLNK
jgi:hypothetical protein